MSERKSEVGIDWIHILKNIYKIGFSCLLGFLGIVLLSGSFFLLFWTETRINFAQIAQNSIELTAKVPPQAVQGKVVSVSGSITSSTPLEDDLYLKPGPYILVARTVEMFAWQENKKSNSKRKKTYSYNKTWLNNPPSSSEFNHPEGHENPIKSIQDQFYKVSEAQIGIYQLDMENLTEINHKSYCLKNKTIPDFFTTNTGSVNLPKDSQLQLSQANVKLTKNIRIMGNYLYKGLSTPDNPVIGDLRICYNVLPVNTRVTIFGQLDNSNRIVPYSEPKITFYRLIPEPRQKAVSGLANEHRVKTWLFRGIGCVVMWMGLYLAGYPIRLILDLVPFLGKLAEGITEERLFITALSLSLLTILGVRLTSDPIVLIAVISLTSVITVILRYLIRQSQF